MRIVVAAAFAAGALLGAASPAAAAPPPNDNRAAAETIPTFPATINGTTVEATVERLDPQVSECGRIEGTVWHRIETAPDGRVVIGVRGAGFAPVVRAYALTRTGIVEIDCGSAGAGGRASASFETTRGAGYLIVVGRRPGTADAAFTLTAELFLPPSNDRRAGARPLRIPSTIRGSTLGATSDDNDPGSCGIQGGSVWYRYTSPRAGRVLLRLAAAGELDAAIAVYEQVRSQLDGITCDGTDRRGRASVSFVTEAGARYLIVVGQRRGSDAGTFTLQALAAQAPEALPGRALPGGGTHATVHGLTDVNDVWWVAMRSGTTYRIAFSSAGCASLALRAPPTRLLRGRVLRTFECGGYMTMTPGPDGGGRYTLEVVASGVNAQRYRLQVAAATSDDLGVGRELRNLRTTRGSLAPHGVDIVDLYHFDVARPSDVRLRLSKPDAASFNLALLTDAGTRIAETQNEIVRRLGRGRYVVAVRAAPGTAGGTYSVSLLVREITQTTLTVAGERDVEVVPGATVTLTTTVTPATGGTIELQIDRFDPLTGWHFFRHVRVAAGSSYSWRPPREGRWRARAAFLGTQLASPSRSGYVRVLVADPLP